MPPPSIRLPNLVKCSLNLRWKSVRSLAYTTCSDVSDSSSSSDASVLCQPLGKFKVTEWKRERISALLFVRHLKESGFQHDVETYMAIVRLLCDLGMDVRLNNLFMYALGNVGFEISHLLEALIEEKLIKAVDVLVKVYASVGRFEEAIHTVSEMRSRSRGELMVSTETCNFIMKELMEREKVDMVESVYRELKRNGLIPNVYTYGILIEGYVRKGRLIETKDVLNQMEVAGVEPNAFIIGTFIHELCSIGKTDLAFEALKNLRESKVVDVFAYYTCVIRGFVKESRLQDAEDVFVEMKLSPDADCYSALIRGYWQKGDSAKALNLRKEMESRVGIKANYAVVRSIIQEAHRSGMLAEALDVFKVCMQYKSEVFLDGALFNIAIDAACKLGRMEDAMGLVEEINGRKMRPWKMHYRTLMNGYCLNGEPWNALYMFQEMMRNELSPDSTDYHVLARGGVFLPLYMLFK